MKIYREMAFKDCKRDFKQAIQDCEELQAPRSYPKGYAITGLNRLAAQVCSRCMW